MAGWLLLITACTPVASNMGWLVILGWGIVGTLILSPRIGLEMHTRRGMIHWCGLIIAWPLTLFLAGKLFAVPAMWAQPPRSSV